MQTGAQGTWGSQDRPPDLEGVLEYPRAGECLVHPSVAKSPQLGLEVRAPGLQPTSPVVTSEGTGGAGLPGPQSGSRTESSLPVKLVPPLF